MSCASHDLGTLDSDLRYSREGVHGTLACRGCDAKLTFRWTQRDGVMDVSGADTLALPRTPGELHEDIAERARAGWLEYMKHQDPAS